MFLFLLFVNLFKTKLIIGSGKKIFFRFFLQASKTRFCVCAACPFPHLFTPQIYPSHFDVIYRVISSSVFRQAIDMLYSRNDSTCGQAKHVSMFAQTALAGSDFFDNSGSGWQRKTKKPPVEALM